jgi:hypothetical protein
MAPTLPERVSWLKRAFRQVATTGFTRNLVKCEFCSEEFRYLRFRVNREGVQMDSDEVEPIASYPAPRNLKQLRRFLGRASRYRRFIPAFASKSDYYVGVSGGPGRPPSSRPSKGCSSRV